MCMFPACCFRQKTYMAQGLVNGVLNETWTHLCLEFEWFLVGYNLIYIYGKDTTEPTKECGAARTTITVHYDWPLLNNRDIRD